VVKLKVGKTDAARAASGRHHLEQTMGSQDTEITLGTGKMLVLFFGLVALCGLFFGLGFSLGRNSGRPGLAGVDPAQTSSGAALRSSAMKSTSTGTPQTGEGLTFYKAVEQKDPNAQLASNDAPKDPPATSANATKDQENQSSAPDPATALAASSGCKRAFAHVNEGAIETVPVPGEMVAGGVAPFMTLVLGNVFEAFALFCRIQSPSPDDRAKLKHDVTIYALELLALAAGALARLRVFVFAFASRDARGVRSECAGQRRSCQGTGGDGHVDLRPARKRRRPPHGRAG